VRGATPGQSRTLDFVTNDYSVLVHKGHTILVTIAAGDASFYKAYSDSGPGGTLSAGPQSTISLPLPAEPRPASARGHRRGRAG
jgi:hypothetical protein